MKKEKVWTKDAAMQTKLNSSENVLLDVVLRRE